MSRVYAQNVKNLGHWTNPITARPLDAHGLESAQGGSQKNLKIGRRASANARKNRAVKK